MKKIIALLLVAIFAAAMFTGCAAKTPDTDPADGENETPDTGDLVTDDGAGESYDKVMADKKLIIGLDDTFVPMGFRENGELVGFDIDLARSVCEEMGVEAVFQPIVWRAKELELKTRKIDCIWNGMSDTAKRQTTMSLSKHYLNNRIIIMTNSNVTINSFEDLKNYNIGTQKASSALEMMQEHPLYDTFKSKVSEFDTYDEVIMDMRTGRIDVMVVDEVLGEYKNAKLGGIFGVSEVNFGDDFYVIGFRKQDAKLTAAINDALAKVIDSGRAEELSEKWFGRYLVISE